MKWGGGGVFFVGVDTSTGVLTTLLSTDEDVEETDLSERVDRVELERWTMPLGRSNL